MAVLPPTRLVESARTSMSSRTVTTYLLIAILSISFSTTVSALNFVPGSPCEAQCSSNVVTYENNTSCLDSDYLRGGGVGMRECTSCLLNSTAYDATTNVSDVEWGLFNLRYTLSECMFGYPAQIVSISSPCQVLCTPLSNAISYGIGSDVQNATDGVMPRLDFCNNGFGGFSVINNCSYCYTFIPQQLFLSNFVQALHIACTQPPVLGQTFYPNGQAIFNESAIPGPSPPSSGQSKSTGLATWKLAIAVALPLVGGTALFAVTCFCCFRFTRDRRRRMAATGRMSRFHDQHAPAESAFNTPVTTRVPPSKYEWPLGNAEPPREMERWSYQHNQASVKTSSPGLAQGRWSQHDPEIEDPPHSGRSIPTEHVGPGPQQAKDPFLHEQYFGDEAGPSTLAPHAISPVLPSEHGYWAR